jgi:hypothetical protein
MAVMVAIGALVVAGDFVSLLDKGHGNFLFSIAPALESQLAAVGSRSALPDAIEDPAFATGLRGLR